MNKRINKIIDNLPEKTKRKILNNAVVWFECRRGISIPYCKCGRNKSISKCEYPLRGKKEGEFCDKLLCKLCGIKIEDKYYCQPHAKMIQK